MRRLALFCAALLLINGALLFAHPGDRAGEHEVRPADEPASAARSDDGVGKALRVGLVFDVGGRGDKSFNDAAYYGVERAERELSIRAEMIEPGDGSDRESGLRLLAAEGFDLVIGVGFIFSDDMFQIASEYPRTRFACVDYAKFGPAGLVLPPPNMAAIKFREEQGAYLVGALAALTSRTRAVGFVGGMDIPLIHKFEEGYRAGALAVCPDCRVLVGYAGVTGDAFKNPGKGKELAMAQYGDGADVIFHASGSTGLGVFEAARATGRYAIGVDADQWGEAPGRVLTSMTKQVDVAIFDIVREVAEGRFVGGMRVFGLDEKGIDYVYDERNRGLLPPGARERVEALRADIIAGRIVVPSERRR